MDITKLLKKGISYLPKGLKGPLIRHLVKIPSELDSEITFKIADCEAELEASFALVYQEYLKLGYVSANTLKLRATVHHALSTTSTLVAIYQGSVVGTLTLVRDNKLGLPLENNFSLAAIRTASKRMAEITSMVIHTDFRRKKGGIVLFGLLKLMYLYATKCFGTSDLVIAIHPKDIDFYSALMFFNQIPSTEVKDYYGAPAVAMSLDLKQATKKFLIYADKKKEKNLHNFFLIEKHDNIHLPRRSFNTVNDPVVTYDYLKSFFIGKTKLVKLSDLNHRRHFLSFYGKLNNKIENIRLDVAAPARLYVRDQKSLLSGLVKDVSLNGFRLDCEAVMMNEAEIEIAVEVGPGKISKLKAKAKWSIQNQTAGFEILQMDSTWSKFIEFLMNDSKCKVEVETNSKNRLKVFPLQVS